MCAAGRPLGQAGPRVLRREAWLVVGLVGNVLVHMARLWPQLGDYEMQMLDF